MENKLKEIKQKFLDEINKISSLKELENIRISYFGKSGRFSELMKDLKNASNEDKPKLGSLINSSKQELVAILEDKIHYFENLEIENKLKESKIDVTLPSNYQIGSKHPITLVIDKIVKTFEEMGFSIYLGTEIDKNEYNFDNLNVSLDHPARDSQDTFYIDDEYLLRSQTTTFQSHVLENKKPPLKMITFGKVYRGDEPDATHMPIFHQLDVMCIDKDLSLADLKGFLNNFAKKMFGEKTAVRMRPSFFPFTEPSVEVDLTCMKCGGKGCAMCKQSGWLEILGGGMMHKNVLEKAGIDSSVYSGFALGVGIERIVMVLTGISDLRILYDNDIRLLSQYR